MSVIQYSAKNEVLLSVKGHPYHRDEFFEIFESLEDVSYTAVEQPAVMELLGPQCCDRYQALVFFDMPGLDFSSQPPRIVEPDDAFKQRFIAMLKQGMGCVFLHHAIASWPAWDEYAEIMGGRFLYRPKILRGETCLDSGYRHDVDQTLSAVASHPVLDGVSPQFKVTDEPYLFEVFNDRIIPLLSSDFAFDREHFHSAYRAVTGHPNCNRDWAHDPGSNVVGWITSYGSSPIVYIQPGDCPTTYQHQDYRRLIANAINWVSSDEAHQWARGC